MTAPTTASATKVSAISLTAAKNYIAKLDLSYIIQYMCSEHYPLPRWTVADATHCCQLYKNFLILFKKHFPQVIVPTREIDEFWHNHILYTKNYYRDSLAIFGHYCHHDPASPDDNPELLVKGYLKTKQYYFEEFQQPLETFQRAG